MRLLSILDRYIIRKFLSTFFFICLIISLISVVIDFSEKLDDMVSEKASFKEIVFDYYFNFIPYISVLLWPLFVLIAVIFFSSRLAGNTEFMAMLGSGASFNRLMRPYIIGASCIMVLHFAFSNYLIPIGNKKRVAFENKYIWKNNFTSPNRDLHINLSKTEEAYIGEFNNRDSTGRNFTYVLYNGREIPYRLSALTIAPVKGKPYHWKLNTWEARTFNGIKETYKKGMIKDTVLNFLASDLIIRDNKKDAMSTPELSRFIAAERKRGSSPALEFSVERYRRTAETFSILILTIMGMAVATRKVRGGLGIHLLIGAASGASFIVMSRFSATFAIQGGLNPLLGVWIPNILFGLVAVWFVRKAQK